MIRRFLLGFALTATIATAAPTIYLIGDSTMADKARADHPERGWGQLFRTLVKEPAKVENHARNGRSTKSFIDENRWTPIVDRLRVGDWVIIQFGHNDEKADKPEVYADPHRAYRDNLIRFVRESISHGAQPVLATSVVRRKWENAKLVPTHGDYPEVARQVAREEGIPLIDMESLTHDLETAYGEEGSKKLHLWFEPGEIEAAPKGIRDDTHYSEEGALKVAQLAAAEMHLLHLDIARWIDWSGFENPPVPWSPDLGDGTYLNPIINADYSDPDVVRVGEDYYMTSSSFSHAPGLPILYSKDLVNWSLINHALPRIEPVDHFSKPQHGNGVWAPSIRHHNGTYYIFWGDPDFGIQVVTATDPAVEWSKPTLVIPGKGLIDPCPLFADDGRVWLVHAWAKSRSGIANRLTLRELTADAMSLKPGDEGETIIDADQITGYRTLEGPKFYQHDGQFWIFAPAGGVETGWQSVFRAKDVRGPYEERIVLSQGRTEINGPHQGGWVRTQNGEDWFIHFQDRAAMGRVVWLEPMVWKNGWPVIGADLVGNDRGEPVLRHRKPDLPRSQRAAPPTSDHFKTKSLGLQWQWEANPSAAVQPKGDGQLHLATSLANPEERSLWDTAQLLMQKPAADDFQVDTTLTCPSSTKGHRAGLIVFGDNYEWLGLESRGDGFNVVLNRCKGAREGGTETSGILAETTSNSIHLRLIWRDAGKSCHWSYSLDGQQFISAGKPFRAVQGRWVGARFGVFARHDENTAGAEVIFSPVKVSPYYPANP